ncbi:MAG: hypothetical protein GX335_08970 [Firmicutes bacterium]|nr:hypothetical protein [Bacillota bacterium]
MTLFLGVDAGGSKTLSIVADASGRVRGLGRAGPGNFQMTGLEKARAQVEKSINLALAQAQADREALCAAYFGMAGADRPADYKAIEKLLKPLLPSNVALSFENDALLGLWAGTLDGIGVGVVCGSGTNVVGVNKQGEKVQIGGMGRIFGDYAGGAYIGELALARARRGIEGRGKPTLLSARLLEHYQVDDLLDLADLVYAGRGLGLSDLVPIVVELACSNDQVARGILLEVGRELGISANAALRRLFQAGEKVKVVGIGGVFRKAKSPLMYEEFVRTLRETKFNVQPLILDNEPVLGAVLAAAAQVWPQVPVEFKAELNRSLTAKLGSV